MSQATSELWKDLLSLPGTGREYLFRIGGVEYGPEAEVSHRYSLALFQEMSIGNAPCATLTVNLFADNIPRGAKIERFVRLVGDDGRTSEYIPKGIFFTNKRTVEDGYWTIEAFDAMRKADAYWMPESSLTFPMTMADAAAEFARLMDAPLDERCEISDVYTIGAPNNKYTIRDELCFIAAAHGGNWVVTDEGKLRLIPLRSAPEESHYLVTNQGEIITVGGVRIVV